MEVRYASVTSRVLAFLMDTVVFFGVAYLVLMAIPEAPENEGIRWISLLLVVGVPTALFTVFLSYRSATPGMAIVDIQVLERERRFAIGFDQAIRRQAAWLLDIAALGLGLIWSAFSERRQTLHDWVSGTIVVERVAIGETIHYMPWGAFWLLVMRITPALTAIVLIYVLLTSSGESGKGQVLLNGVAIACITSIGATLLFTALMIRKTRVRLTPVGIQRSGLWQWKKKAIGWGDIEYCQVVNRRYFPYFRCHKRNRKCFRIPLNGEQLTLTAQVLQGNGVRLEY
jgi:uncharacterized RDD family membrane protein YckC